MSEYHHAQQWAPARPGRSTVDSAKPRVLFIGETAALSHVARPAMLASYLASRGYSVCFARDPRYNHLLQPDENVPRIDIKSEPSSTFLRRIHNNEPLFPREILEKYVQIDLETIREFKPDIVVGDSRFSLIVSSRLTGVPFVSIVDAHWSPWVDTKFELADSPISRLIGTPLSDFIFHIVRPVVLPIAFAIQVEPINSVLRKHGLPEIAPDIRAYFTCGDYAVHPNDSGLYRLREPLPPEHAFIGPLLWSAQVPPPAWWDRLPAHKPIVYVSLGSTGEPALLQTVFRVLGELPVTVIAATAARINPSQLPRNVFLAEFIPGMEAARRSRFVICNGGAMSGQQAVSAGVPYLGLISNLDQMLYSMAVEQAGACELMRESEVTDDSLRRLALRLLSEDKYRVAAQKIARRTAQQDSCLAFEQFLSGVLRTRMLKGTARAGH
jgi:UDP:flavonoid glycosyltransferase YjiC (YdhE family)